MNTHDVFSKPAPKLLLTVLCWLFFLLHPWTGLVAQETEVSSVAAEAIPTDDHPYQGWTLVIHGGAGGPAKGSMLPEMEKAYETKLGEALQVGAKILANGGTAMDAVEKVVFFMEDCPLFNAGKGAVLNADGKVEMDASIMDGKTGMAGAVAGVTTIKNPIVAARMVMDKTSHVMLSGRGAEDFAKKSGIAIIDPAYFITPERQEAWRKWKAAQSPIEKAPSEKEKHGTVGAVALDQYGNLAAATSTGGLMGKLPGRIGDSPVIGAGTFARNSTCAVSATGQGEYFMRNLVAYDLSAMMEYREMPLEEAAKIIVHEKLALQKASGGLIAIDRNGNIAMPFNTNAMYRGYIRSNGEQKAEIY